MRSETYKRNIKANKIVVSEFGTMIYPDPCKNIFSRYGPLEIRFPSGSFVGGEVWAEECETD